ncbi:hypothetical protein F7725_002739 [Dissostichus mawsoni]|uniref:Uncharacterized protein n=1 Tax=Dissostichus mawsoni TaxID=36200 RepID=A0A7J5Y9M0_DISMA|nr:hypothetical protein F7725_002739 [Dissostichus mawsoni]
MSYSARKIKRGIIKQKCLWIDWNRREDWKVGGQSRHGEDVAVRHQRALRYLIHRDMALSATCDDLQNRLRRNNVRIFQVPEG